VAASFSQTNVEHCEEIHNMQQVGVCLRGQPFDHRKAMSIPDQDFNGHEAVAKISTFRPMSEIYSHVYNDSMHVIE